jgi:hypothetical protein
MYTARISLKARPVNPGSADYILPFPGNLGAALLSHIEKISKQTPGTEVVPAATVETGDLHLIIRPEQVVFRLDVRR